MKYTKLAFWLMLLIVIGSASHGREIRPQHLAACYTDSTEIQASGVKVGCANTLNFTGTTPSVSGGTATIAAGGGGAGAQHVTGFQLTEGAAAVSFNNTTVTELSDFGSGPQWNKPAAVNETCLSADVGGTGRGTISYSTADASCPTTMTVMCRWSVVGVVSGVADDTGEFLYFGIIENSATTFPSLADQVGFELDDTNSVDYRGAGSGAGIFDLSDGDYLRLGQLGYSTSGDAAPMNFSLYCEEAGSTGAAGADGDFAADGPTNEAVLTGRANNAAKSTSATLSTLEMSGSVITNQGAAGTVTLTMGSASCSSGMNFSVLHYESQPIRLQPFASDQIINLTDTVGDYLESDGVTSSGATCNCVSAGEWLCPTAGTWTEQ